MMGTKKSEVATRPTSAVAVSDYAEYFDQGFENQTGADIVLPFLNVLQALSPQVTDQAVEGARPGLLHNSVTDRLYDGEEGLEFIPALTEHTFVEWIPRNQGGGFVGRHEIDSEVVAKAKAQAAGSLDLKTDAGNSLTDTFYVYGVVIEDGEPVPVAIAFSITKVKVYKKWNTNINMFTLPVTDENGNTRKVRPPIFAHTVRITSTREKNRAGQEYFNFSLAPANGTLEESLIPPTDERFQRAVELRDLINQGLARASFETQGPAGTEGGDTPPF